MIKLLASRVFLIAAMATMPMATALGATGENLTFSGTDLSSGKSLSMAVKTAKKGTVVTFLSSVCPCSKSHEPILESLQKKYGTDFQFIVLNSNANEKDEAVKKYFKDFKVPVLRDHGSKWALQLDAMKTPHTYVLSPKGEIVYQGGMTDSSRAENAKIPYLENALAALSKGTKPEQTETRALGCYIMRPDDM